MPRHLFLKRFGPVHALPVLHYRMEFAHLVREAFDRVQPDCVAIELPATLESPFTRALQRLPRVSVLMYEVNPRRSEQQTACLLVEPADPLVEAGRQALERGCPLRLVDLDLDTYPEHFEPMPDSYAVQRLGLKEYYEQFVAATRHREPAPEDVRREKGMAYRLRELAARYERILFVGGMAHIERLEEQFEIQQSVPLERVKRDDVRLSNLHPESCREVMAEYAFLSAVYELRRGPLPEPAPQSGLTLRKRFHAFELINGGKRDIPELAVLREAVERSARMLGREGCMPDRQRIGLRLFEESARHYRQETGERVHIWQKRSFFKFTRNYALTCGQLLPDLFQLLAGARGCIDDNFAYALWRLATTYPWQEESAEIPTVRLTAEDIWSGSRRIRFRPREKHPRKGLSHLQFLKRKREQRPGEWLEGFDDPSICSYPPEDLVIETYGTFLKQKGAKQLSEEHSRVEPFSASLLDGIDMRETLRNLHEGRIYVRENQRVKGGVGAVVIVFDEDREQSRYPFLMTWLGEHDQESDMAFYATPPTDNVVGPGISRCEYGGLVLCYPPRRMADVWHDPDYVFARSKAEVLLLAALDYSREPHILYAAARPPRSYLRQLAGRLGKKIIHLPIGSLSPVTLKKIRVFHILAGKDKRGIARDFIW